METHKFSRLILIFSVCFSVLLISPAFLKSDFPIFMLLRLGDVTDLATPIILLPLYWTLFQLRLNNASMKEISLFLIFAALLAQGQGMHLSANSIDNILTEKTSDIYMLTHFFDEVLSHYIWFFGTIGLTSILLYRQFKNPFANQSKITLEVIAALFYGITNFISVIEAQLTPVGIPYSILVVFFGFMNRKKLKQQPLLLFFFLAHLLSLILFAAWGFYFKGFPEFSSLGLI